MSHTQSGSATKSHLRLLHEKADPSVLVPAGPLGLPVGFRQLSLQCAGPREYYIYFPLTLHKDKNEQATLTGTTQMGVAPCS